MKKFDIFLFVKLQFFLQISPLLNEIDSNIQCLLNACNILLTSGSFKRFCYVVLAVGNYANAVRLLKKFIKSQIFSIIGKLCRQGIGL